MFSAIARIFKTPDLRRKIVFTLAIVALFRLGSFVPAPFVHFDNVQACLVANQTGTTGIYEMINMFSGGALLQLSIFALGIMPYITASIITQLLRVVIPHFEALHKEGQAGQGKLTQYTRYLTIALAVLQSTVLITMARSGMLFGTSANQACQNLVSQEWWAIIIMILTL
ncbi:MAG: preprotein translocase subunit SecY, partial [Microbacteriaceae bacterium]|nr:preprotein translocase subunit SecY [Microbacteriaceae bacterium]